MTTIHTSPPPGAPSFAIYEDPEDLEPPSPSEVYEGDTSFDFDSELSLMGADEVIPSIELDESGDEPRPYSSSYTKRPPSCLQTDKLRRASGLTTTSFISSLPSEISYASKPAPPETNGADAKYAPRKDRAQFRNPASVRAMQMSSPPPFAAFEGPRVKGTYKLATPSRSGTAETPLSASGRSRRSASRRDGRQREPHPHAQQSPRPTPTPQQHLPLVLLHVTILPMQEPYSQDFMIKAMPPWLVENYKLLADKLNDVVLMRRGLLIPHPNEEYDLLEERILESLELKTPRLLKCGHFVGPVADEEGTEDIYEEDATATDDGRGSRMSGGTITVEDGDWKHDAAECDDSSVCADCHRQVKKPGKGAGAGNKRWDIKIYAANGLMRSGAWSAAWREMERCDVEIAPWIPDDVRKALEKRFEEEQELETQIQMYDSEVQRKAQEESARLKELEAQLEERKRNEEDERQKRLEAEECERQRKKEDEEVFRIMFEEALNEKVKEAKEALRQEFGAQHQVETAPVEERIRVLEEKLESAQAKNIRQEVSEKIRQAKEALQVEFEFRQRMESAPVNERIRLLEEKLKKSEAKTVPQAPPVQDPPIFEQFARAHAQVQGRPRSVSKGLRPQEIPLGTLVRNYLLVQARDRRNLIILALGALLVFFAVNRNGGQQLMLAPPALSVSTPEEHHVNVQLDAHPKHSPPSEDWAKILAALPSDYFRELVASRDVPLPVSSDVVTNPATSTATAVVTTTVTYMERHSITVQQSPAPVSDIQAPTPESSTSDSEAEIAPIVVESAVGESSSAGAVISASQISTSEIHIPSPSTSEILASLREESSGSVSQTMPSKPSETFKSEAVPTVRENSSLLEVTASQTPEALPTEADSEALLVPAATGLEEMPVSSEPKAVSDESPSAPAVEDLDSNTSSETENRSDEAPPQLETQELGIKESGTDNMLAHGITTENWVAPTTLEETTTTSSDSDTDADEGQSERQAVELEVLENEEIEAEEFLPEEAQSETETHEDGISKDFVATTDAGASSGSIVLPWTMRSHNEMDDVCKISERVMK